jgi:hypothetical protein
MRAALIGPIQFAIIRQFHSLNHLPVTALELGLRGMSRPLHGSQRVGFSKAVIVQEQYNVLFLIFATLSLAIWASTSVVADDYAILRDHTFCAHHNCT